MGSLLQKCRSYQTNILIVGLNNSGKTSLLYRLMGLKCTPIHTIGFNNDIAHFNQKRLCLWDIGGGDKIMELWKHYYQTVHAFIFMVDSTDANSMQDAKYHLHRMVNEIGPTTKPLLIACNKTDLKNALPLTKLSDLLDVNSIKTIKYQMQGISALNGEGVNQALDWLVSQSIVNK